MLISVEDATKIVLTHSLKRSVETVPLEQSLQRVLAEDLLADRDFPPFTRVSMDGIAIAFEAFEKGQRQFPISGMQAAGSPQLTLRAADTCVEVMTGAILPEGTDTVIRYEDLEIKDQIASIQIEDVRQGQNAHLKGFDRKSGDVLVQKGSVISPAEVGVAATVGRSDLSVFRLPKTVVISTGDELVEIDETPLPYQIRKSNVFSIQAVLRRHGLSSDRLHLLDQKEDVRNQLKKALEEYDLLLMSGGVSRGKFDYVPEILEELRVEKLFHRVQQRPGKPFWFGKSQAGKLVFAFPGNPVSTFMCTHRYFLPWLRHHLAQPPFPEIKAQLASPFDFKPDLTYFLQVRIAFDTSGTLFAYPIAGRGSGDLANLVDTDGFLELPTGQTHFKAGGLYPLYLYRSII
jgi:molybdopterin molybdotransferase